MDHTLINHETAADVHNLIDLAVDGVDIFR